jgi:hypothetical protein
MPLKPSPKPDFGFKNPYYDLPDQDWDLQEPDQIGPVEDRKFWLDMMRSQDQTYGWDRQNKEYYSTKDRSQYDHGAVPENVKQSMLSDMLDHYGNVNMQHMLVPEEYEKPRPRGMPDHLSYDSTGTRFVPAQGAVDMGHMGPDYITMMNIMNAQKDPEFDIGFMTEDYMKSKYPKWDKFYETEPSTGAYFMTGREDIALNPYHTLDFSDPNVDKAFSLGAGKPRTLNDLTEDTKLKISQADYDKDPGTVGDNWDSIAHEIGHYGSLTEDHEMHGHGTQDVNLTKKVPWSRYGIRDKSIMDVPFHNESYWVGRRNDPWYWENNRQGNMYLNAEAADNIRNWTNEAKRHIDPFPQGPRSVVNENPPNFVGDPWWPEFPSGTPNFAPPTSTAQSNITPRPHPNTHNPHFDEGGIVGLPGQWSPATIIGDEETFDIKSLGLDPGIMSIDDLEDLFEEAGLDKKIIYDLINTGGLSQLVV